MISLIIIIVLSYLVGSIPTSIIFSKLFKGIDIRNYGSGNAGGTNAWRVLGWKIGLPVMLIDIGKGVVATVLLASIRVDSISLSNDTVQILAGVTAVFGHIWTVFAGFKGGKGVGTAAGMIIGLYPLAAAICLIIFGIVLAIGRIVSVSSMSAAISLPIVLTIMRHQFQQPVSSVMLGFAIFVAILIVFTHRSNIKRLLNGEENRIGKKKGEPAS